MTKFQLFHLKNEMSFANAFANLIAVTFVHKLMFKAEPLPTKIFEIPIVNVTNTIFDILDKYRGEVKIEDDITSVIIKMQN